MFLATPGLPQFDYVRPASLAEASRLLASGPGRARPLLGGTDLFPKMREGEVRPELLVDLKHLPGMRRITYDGTRGLQVGAGVTMNEIAGHPEVRDHYPLLAEAANAVGSYQLRNRATIGGNLCNASPCADTGLATLVLDGRVTLYRADSSGGGDGAQRELPLTAFLVGPGETALRSGEVMTAVRFPPPAFGASSRYLKLSRSRLGDLALVSVAVIGFGASGLTDAGFVFRIGLGSVAPTVVRAQEAEATLLARPPGDEAFSAAADAAAEAASPIDDVRAGSAYRKAMVRNLTVRGLADVWQQLRSTPTRGTGG